MPGHDIERSVVLLRDMDVVVPFGEQTVRTGDIVIECGSRYLEVSRVRKTKRPERPERRESKVALI